MAKKRAESGLAAVEFAIVLPVLMLLLMGVIEYGFFFYCDTAAANAAREGARAATLTYTCGCNACNDCATDATPAYCSNVGTVQSVQQDLTSSAAAVYLSNVNLKASTIVATYTADSSPAVETSTGSNATCLWKVTVTVPYSSITGYMSTFMPSKITAVAEMRGL